MLVINFASWDWPQWLLLSLYATSLAFTAILHGKGRPDYNIGFTVVDIAICLGLLAAGGFFS